MKNPVKFGTSEAILFGALDGLREDVRESFQSVHQRFARLKRSHATNPTMETTRGSSITGFMPFFFRETSGNYLIIGL